MKKHNSVLAICLAASLVLSACGGAQTTSGADVSSAPASVAAPSKDPVKITIWYEGNDSRLPYFKAVEREMQKDYPNYSIDAVTFDNATLITKSLQAVTTTGGVDLVFNEASRLLQTHLQSNGGYELLESATIDGASEFQVFYKIMVPVMSPVFTTAILISFLTSWGLWLPVMMLSQDMSTYNLASMLVNLNSDLGVDLSQTAALSTVISLPVILTFLLTQRKVMNGIVAGSVNEVHPNC